MLAARHSIWMLFEQWDVCQRTICANQDIKHNLISRWCLFFLVLWLTKVAFFAWWCEVLQTGRSEGEPIALLAWHKLSICTPNRPGELGVVMAFSATLQLWSYSRCLGMDGGTFLFETVTLNLCPSSGVLVQWIWYTTLPWPSPMPYCAFLKAYYTIGFYY